MKNLILLISLILASANLFATETEEAPKEAPAENEKQPEDQEYKSVILKEIKALSDETGRFITDIRDEGFYGAYLSGGLGYSPNLDRNAFYTQGGIGLVLARTYTIGMASNQLRTKIKAPTDDEKTIRFSYQGLDFGYIFSPDSMIHLKSNLFLGKGHISMMMPKPPRDSHFKDKRPRHGKGHLKKRPHDREDLYIVKPEIALEVNITTWLRYQLGGGYRFVFGDNIGVDGVEKKDLYNYTITTGFVVGLF